MVDAYKKNKKNPITIVFVLGGLGIGGNESKAISLITYVDRKLFTPIIVSLTSDTGPTETQALALGVQVFRFPIEDLGIARFLWKFSDFVREQKASSVISLTFSKLHLYVLAAARLGGATKRIAVASASPPDRSLKKMRLLQLASRFVCTQEVANGQWVASWLKSFGGYPQKRIIVIANGCEVGRIWQRAEARRDLKTKHSKRVIMVARLEAAKDHETLLRSMELVRNVIPDAEVLLVGDGPRRYELEQLAASLNCGAIFLGSRSDVPELLGEAEVFVLSTHTEGLPVSIIEAMASGLPVVASDIPPCREVLDGGRGGILFPVGDAHRLAQYLVRLLGNEDFLHRYQAASRARAVHYEISDMVSAFEALLASG